ncbi:hypothetical protein C8A05DRAFT_40473 [Staphylotrichum tortipilum]|uniref:RING-type domain-containing protein n=1 Tax=Staphylotrichum tortipilum TaxID=2831512 RepID=A0AAN6MUY7_9PEZI|nr:hypothetical protein C8A05DRAFT_40473 [Staphylotrichum longicolle]
MTLAITLQDTKRELSEHDLVDSSDQSGDEGERHSRPITKKLKVSLGNEEHDNPSAADPGLGCSVADQSEGIDAPAGGASGRLGKPPKPNSIDTNLPPLSDVREMFEDMVKRVKPVALQKSPIKLNVATLCSGTDAPIFALNLIQEALQAMGFGAGFEFKHHFSCEIEPFKQGFIRRNLPHGTLIFRDLVELASANLAGGATTACGSKAPIPEALLDILFAGCSCVDYSHMNQNKPASRVPSLDRHLKQNPNNKKGKGKNKDAETESAPVKLDDQFIKDLDPGLDELLRTAGGESARTFFAAVKLITVIRPKLIILENVLGAPWAMYTNQLFPRICYVARWVKLDSKEFYLPQTRQRGYLVAVDAMRFGVEQATKIAAEWEAQLSDCKRAPSAPVSDFLRPADDPATIQARADMESKTASSSEWALCSLRHADARQKYGIRRDDNPFSHKTMRSGRLIHTAFPAHSWLQFWRNQGSRVIDLMDIAFAIANQGRTDMRYKTGMIDVSQNVDRNYFVLAGGARATKALGIIGCITPSGMPIVTDLMRPVTGTETLALQGLPVDEMVISTETQGQLRDLAGNAMTVTVVGAVTLALLLSVCETHPDSLTRLQSAQLKAGQLLDALRPEMLTAGRTSAITTNVGSLLSVAKDMVRLCYCSARPGEVLVCNTCRITACPACRGNPAHAFGEKQRINTDHSPEQGRIWLKDHLPKALRLPVPPSIVHPRLDLVGDDLYCSVVSGILTGDPVYYFDDIKVTEAVVVCYKAINSIARLVLSSDLGCCWYIYIAPWHPARAQLAGTFDFNQPVARGQPLPSDDIEILQWSVWAPGHISLTLNLGMNTAGALVASGLSFTADHGPEPDPSLLAWKKLVEGKVCGTYVHHPKCGTAGNALRIKQSTAHTSKVFMMWDSAGLRSVDGDHFVWTDQARRLEPHEYRETWLHADSTLHWELDSGLGSVGVSWPGYWSSRPDLCPDYLEVNQPKLVQDLAQIHWGSTQSIQQASCHTEGLAPVANMPVLASITGTFEGFPVSATRLSKMDARQTNNKFLVVPSAGCDSFLRQFSFLSSSVRNSRTPADLASFPHLHHWVPIASCGGCSVTPPEVIVHTKEDKKSTPEGKKQLIKAIIEDPDDAARFERQFQDLPRAVAVSVRVLGSYSRALTLDMRLMLQPKTLASRALAYLLQAHRTRARGRLALDSEAKTSYRVCLDYAPQPNPSFAPFSQSITPCGEEFTFGIDASRASELPFQGPPRFHRDNLTAGGMLTSVHHELRSSQKNAVIWMLRRERAPLDFIKREVEEEVVGPLNLRVMGKAEWASRFPFSSRGGVVAHEIGYGKTVVTLALIDCMREFDRHESITERKQAVDMAWSEELLQALRGFGDTYPQPKSGDFFIHLPATLVIVPRHITAQWAQEAQKFLGLAPPKLLIIQTVEQFYRKHALDELQKAEIIIVSSSVFRRAFLDRLQAVAGRGSEYPAGLSGRTLAAWYTAALRNHRILTAHYRAARNNGIREEDVMKKLSEAVFPELIRRQQAEIDAVIQKQVPEINRQTYKKNNKNSGQPAKEDGGSSGQGSTQQPKKAATAKGSEKTWGLSSLHNYSFARVVWDECSYDDDEILPLFVANAVASAKWLLTGTPKLFGLEHVCNLAAAFGIHVARPEPRIMPGLPAVTKGPVLEPMSKSEQFHIFSSPVKSSSLAQERHSQAESFVSSFFRANALGMEVEVEFEDHVQPVTMPASDAVRYHLLHQQVLDAAYDYTALPDHARNQVSLKGNELSGRDGSSAAKMLLCLLACGLGAEKGSINALAQALATRSDDLSDQMKLLWDKTMWLHRWMRDLDSSNGKTGMVVQEAMNRTEGLCGSLEKALGSGSFEEFGGMEMFRHEAAVVAGLGKKPHGTRPDLDSLQAEWGTHFSSGWSQSYSKNKALYTWADFFNIDSSVVPRLSDDQLRMLAEDILWLRYKLDANAAPPFNSLPDAGFLQKALATGKPTIPRSVPETIEGLVGGDASVLDDLGRSKIERFILACVAAKPAVRTWKDAKDSGNIDFGLVAGKTVKAALYERLTEFNLKFTASFSADKLKEMVWRHENGLGVCENYRDGRAAPDKHRDFEAATAVGGTTDKQIDAVNEELKRTMVHLAKTTEDLRATRLEANFVPEYLLLAKAHDKDVVLKDKLCGGCCDPLTSASTSFLVVACGHSLCKKCKSATDRCCPVKDCPAFIRERPVLRYSQLPSLLEDEPRTKADCVSDLIKGIPKDENIVVFAQFNPLIAALASAFKKAKLKCLNLADMNDEMIARRLEDFKAGKAGQILLLDMDSETSAGSNLTIATHVIFASPYMHPDEEHQAKTVQQARGRCIRTGQTKKVHVYHFMVCDTIEEEVLRELGKSNPAVKEYFEKSERTPWWMDEDKEEDGDEADDSGVVMAVEEEQQSPVSG